MTDTKTLPKEKWVRQPPDQEDLLKEIFIEENIPVPNFRWGKYSSIAHKMKVGDSVLCKNYNLMKGIRGAIDPIKGCRPISRKQGNGTWRVWKIDE